MRVLKLTVLLLVLGLLGWSGSAFAQGKDGKDAKPSYEFDLKEVGGKEHVTFKELADSGRPFLLFFWISECPHCKRQLPFVELMYRNMQKYDVGVDIYTINADKVEEQAEATILERGLQAPVLWDPDVKQTEISMDMREKGTPRVWIFKPGGELVEDFGSFNSNLMVYALDKMGVELPKDLAHLKPKS
ncbi:MAG: TlpA family protein disulfide reductase [Planctomycetales bacterium]|nr:TlpA family protein disulfide reductase [bacterium]UNM09291.1 MAG: TlpA family protein disulfide reductase [Planctomycetales bacterium]